MDGQGVVTDGAWDHSGAVKDGLARAAVDGAVDGEEGAGRLRASNGLGGVGGSERERLGLSHCSSCCCGC